MWPNVLTKAEVVDEGLWNFWNEVTRCKSWQKPKEYIVLGVNQPLIAPESEQLSRQLCQKRSRLPCPKVVSRKSSGFPCC